MKIKRIYIDGYRSLKNFEIDNLNDINIFYGENNTGKSNIIDALRLFFSKKEKTAFKEGETEAAYKFQGTIDIKRSDFYKNQETPVKFEIELLLDNQDISRLKEIGRDDKDKPLLKKDGNKITIKSEINSDLQNEKKGTFSITSLLVDNKETLEKDPSKKKTDYKPLALTIQNYITDKFKLIDSSRQIIREISSGETEASVSEHNIQKYLYEKSHSPNEKDHILFRKINTIFNDLYGIDWDIEFSVEPETPTTTYSVIDRDGTKSIIEKIYEKNELKIRIFSKKEHLLLPIGNFGTGLKQSLIILANMITNDDAKIFGIEEVELNLSPKSQETFFKKLLELKGKNESGIDQLFITSHSPVFENKKTSICNVYMIELKDEKTSIVVMTPKKSAEHNEPLISIYKLCRTCDDFIYSSISIIAKKAEININEAKNLYEKNSQKLCDKCISVKICDKTHDELINFVATQLKSYM